MNELAKKVLEELYNYPGKSLKFKIKNGMKKALKRGGKPNDPVNWPNALMALGLLDYAMTLEEENPDRSLIIESVCKYFDEWIKKGSKLRSIEDGIAGEVLIKLHSITGDIKYKEAYNKILYYVIDSPRNLEKSIIYNPDRGNKYIFVDMLGMVCPLISKEKSDDSWRQITNFIESGFNKEHFLPFHAYDYENKSCLGMAAWCRACGWFVRGLSYSIKNDMDKPELTDKLLYIERLDLLVKTMNTLFLYVRKDDLFSWQLNFAEGHVDTSGSALIYDGLFEALSGIRIFSKQTGDKSYDDFVKSMEEKLEKGALALKSKISRGRVEDAEAECADFGIYPQIYASYPWADGPTLSFLSKMKML